MSISTYVCFPLNLVINELLVFASNFWFSKYFSREKVGSRLLFLRRILRLPANIDFFDVELIESVKTALFAPIDLDSSIFGESTIEEGTT